MMGRLPKIAECEIMIDGKFQAEDVSMLDLIRFVENQLIQEYNVI
jgi:hypothetical protein